MTVDLIVNCYERTYRQVLAPGFFPGVAAMNADAPAARWVLVNNVADPADAARRADALVAADELDGWSFVVDRIDEALDVAGLPRRALRSRPYFLDYGLVMAVTGQGRYVLGWDAETVLDEPADWIGPAVALLAADPGVFSASPRWPARGFDSLPAETVAERGPWALNYGFSDQVFLARRDDLASPMYRACAPAAVLRHSSHPFTFEARVEAYQRATGRPRATHREVRYSTNDLAPVLTRVGGYTRAETLRRRVLDRARTAVAGRFTTPRLRVP